VPPIDAPLLDAPGRNAIPRPMLAALFYAATAYILTSNGAPAVQRRVEPAMISEDQARAEWLAKLDAPAWSAAAKAMSTLAADAEQFQTLSEECNQGATKACDTLSKEDEAKQAWLAKIDVPAWGKAAEAMEAMFVAEQVPVASSSSTPEEAAKKAWLAKLDVPVWGKLTEEQAKQKWLSRLDAPVWGQAAAAMTLLVSEATKFADLTEDCNAGVIEACGTLSKEDEAKQAWLAKLDVPSWGKMSEEQAKKAWLAKLEETLKEKASWQGKITPTSQAGPVLLSLEVSEEEAKKAWLAARDLLS